MRRLLDRFYGGCTVLSCISIVFIVAVVFLQVVLSTIDAAAAAVGMPGFGMMIPSYSMFSGYGLAFATFLALGPAIRRGAHIRVTLIQGRLPQSAQRVALALIALIGTIIGALMTWALVSMTYESWDFGDQSSGLVAVPLWIPQSVLCLGACAFLVACADLLVETILTGQSAGFDDVHHEEDNS